MADSLWMKLRKVPWEKFPANPGTDKKVAKILENMASRKEPRAMKASHELWSALCGGAIAPAAEASIPFLAEILKISPVAVQSEILDMFLKFATADSEKLMVQLLHISPAIKKLTYSRDEIVADKAMRLLKLLA